MTLIYDKCAVGWITLGRNLVNQNPTLIKPNHKSDHRSLKTFEKSK